MKKVQDRYQNDIFNWVNNKYTALSLLQPPHKPSNWLKELFFQSLPSQKLSLSHLILIDCHPETRELKLSIGTKVSQSLNTPHFQKLSSEKGKLLFCISYQEVASPKLGRTSICQIQSLFCRYPPPKKSSSFGHISIPSSSVFCPFRYLVWRGSSRPEGPALLHELHLHHVLHLWVRPQAHRFRARGEYSTQIGVKVWNKKLN